MLIEPFDCPVWGCDSHEEPPFGSRPEGWLFFQGLYYCPKHKEAVMAAKFEIERLVHALNFPPVTPLQSST